MDRFKIMYKCRICQQTFPYQQILIEKGLIEYERSVAGDIIYLLPIHLAEHASCSQVYSVISHVCTTVDAVGLADFIGLEKIKNA